MAQEDFRNISQGCLSCVMDFFGLYGDLLSLWNPISTSFEDFSSIVGIILKRVVKCFSHPLKLVNYYGPYGGMHELWDKTMLADF